MGGCLACDVEERNLGEMQKRLNGGKVLVSNVPKVTLVVEELLGLPSMKFRPNAFTLNDLQLRIVMEVTGKKEDLVQLEPQPAEESLMKSIFGKMGMGVSKEKHKLKLVATTSFMKQSTDDKVAVSITNFKDGVESFKHVLSGGRASAFIEEGMSKMVSQVIHDMLIDDTEDVMDELHSDGDGDLEHMPFQGNNVRKQMRSGAMASELNQPPRMTQELARRNVAMTSALDHPAHITQELASCNQATDFAADNSPSEQGSSRDLGIYGDFLSDGIGSPDRMHGLHAVH